MRHAHPARGHIILALLALLLLGPLMAACKEVQPGSGLETIRHKQHHDGGPGGK